MRANVSPQLARTLPAALLGLLLVGCGKPSSSLEQPAPIASAEGETSGTAEASGSQPVGPEDGARPGVDPDAAAASGGAVSVRIVDEKEFGRALEQYRGKVVLVDFWATWCPSCLELFPHTVELHKRYADRGLAVISLSMDDPDDEPAVLERLKSNQATFDNLISRYGGSDKSIEAFGLEDLVLPRYHVYDRTGKLRTKLRSSGRTIKPGDIDRAVEELLGES